MITSESRSNISPYPVLRLILYNLDKYDLTLSSHMVFKQKIYLNFQFSFSPESNCFNEAILGKRKNGQYRQIIQISLIFIYYSEIFFIWIKIIIARIIINIFYNIKNIKYNTACKKNWGKLYYWNFYIKSEILTAIYIYQKKLKWKSNAWLIIVYMYVCQWLLILYRVISICSNYIIY